MQLSDATPATIRTARVAAFGLGLGLVFVLGSARGWGQQSAPTVPTIPVPVPVVRTHPAHAAVALPGGTAHTQAADPKAQELKAGDPKGQEPKPAEPKADEVPVPELSLGECITIALERQPTLKAARATMEATEASLRGLNGIGRIGQALSPDLPIRKEQAMRGITASAADLQKVHNEVVQDVSRLYYTVVYARQQELLAAEVAGRLDVFVDVVTSVLNSKKPGTMTPAKLDAMKIGLAEARTVRAQTQYGQKQAMAALREVMAVDEGSFPFRVKDKELPVMRQTKEVTRDLVVNLALEQRPELALAAAGVDAFRLEVYAQGKIPFRRSVPTFASGSDIHAREVPQAIRTLKDYRPGAIPPEMPPQLVGTKYDRVCRAMAYSQRADAVYEKARNLIVLEGETAFYDLEQAGQRLTWAKEKFDRGQRLAKYAEDNFAESNEKDALFTVYVTGMRAQSDYVEAVYQYLLSLAAIERVTAGGIRPDFPGRPRP